MRGIPQATRRPSAGALAAAAFVAGFAAVMVLVSRVAGADDAEPAHLSETFGLPIPYLGVAAVVSAGAVFDRPWAWVAAGIGLLPIAVISFAGLGLPLLVPAIYLVVRGLREIDRWPVVAVVLVPVLGLVLAGSFLALFVSQDPTSWTNAHGTGTSSDHIAGHEAALSLTLATIAILLTLIPLPHAAA